MSIKGELLKRWEALKAERQTWVDHWRELAEQVRPRGSRFLASDRNQGTKRNGSIINSRPILASRTLAAGMMSGITSPARPWFKLTTPDSRLAETDAVKAWLVAVEEELRTVMHRSNFYDILQVVYSDLTVPGTAAMHIDEDSESGIRCYAYPAGQYALALDEKGRVDTCFREVSLTVRQMARRFGVGRCSQSVQSLHREGRLDKWVECLHAVQPRDDVRGGALGAARMPWASYWLEAKSGDSEGLLLEGGYEEFPVCAPRWYVTGEDVYGTSPAMDALGDCKALQVLEKRKAWLVDKLANPPMNAPPQLRSASLLPGAINHVSNPSARFEPAYLPAPAAVQVVGEEIRQHEKRIDQAFYADLWLMLSQYVGTMTAREVSERREEKLLQLGPVLQRVSVDLLDPAVGRVFSILQRQGRLPPPPREIQGQDLKLEYLNIMAQAQKLLGTTNMERLTSFTVQVAQSKPEVLDKLDLDQTVDEYAAALGVPPTTVRPDDAVQAIRAQRAKAQAKAAQLEQAQLAADATQKLAAAPMDASNPNALTEMLRAVGAR